MSEWKKVSMKDNLEILTGYAFSSKNFNEEEGIPLIRIRDLETHNPVTLYKGDYDDKYIINKGDILVGMDGEFNIVRWKGPKALLNQRVAKINSKNPNIISEDFIFYRLQGELREIEVLTPATTVKHLSKKDIEDLNLLLPPLGEQSKIASILSSVDEAIEKTEAIIEQTEKVKKGLMQQLLTKGIGHTKFKKTEIGEIPEEWEVKSISEVAKVVSGGTPSKQISEYWENGTIPWATPTDITSNDNKYISTTQLMITESGLRNSSANLLPKGSVLMTSRATIGPRCINTVPMATNQGFKSFICDPDVLHNEYLYYLIDKIKDQFIALASGSTFLEISKSAVETFKIPVPPLEEQIEIAKMLSSLDEKLSVEKVKKESLQTIKKALMQVLLTGKVRVKVDNEVMSQ
ncbi:restriction endonuclease subunit S [Anoxybacillus flavithermus]|uniref:restriction endonuclease subunit S n=1 Tax=Anoxybacillus flavithermus TaxID=33934 RepID=UPI00186894F3|nr:restriction endonuclease subunit S [Anoxybacillus flavithermus]